MPTTTIFAAFSDMTLTLVGSPSLDPSDPIPIHWTLHFRDIPTDTQTTISCENENDAVYLAAAWMVADSPDIGVLEPYRKRLYTLLDPKKFLP